MIHGDIVTITSKGILIHEKALQPLGIYNKSVCWAVWSANPYGNRPHPNLIVSPIHPSAWPFLIRLEIAINDKEGALAWLCEQLEEQKLSILFLEGTTTGFGHALCNVIAENTDDELTPLRDTKEVFDRNHPYVRISPSTFKEARDIANKISAIMFDRVRKIEEHFTALNQKSERFLHNWSTDQRFLFEMDKVAAIMNQQPPNNTEEEEHRKFIQKHFPKSMTAQYMQRLAYFSIYGGGVDVPFSLQYEADSALLKLETPEIFSLEGIRIYEQGGLFTLSSLPSPAISTFNTQEKYLRLKPVTPDIVKHHLTRIGIEYRLEQQTQQRDPTASIGLLRLICERLQEANVNLLHNSNKWTRFKYAREAGLFSFIADVPKENYKHVKQSLEAINVGKSPKLKSVKISDVKVEEYPQRILFISLHFRHPRESDIIHIIETVAHECGFEKALVETHVAPATRTIVEKIASCQAFLQLLVLRESDNPESMSFSWLDFEYGVASGKGMPTVRLVDTVRVTYDWWKTRITTNPDQRVKDFRSDASEEALTKTIREVIEELTQELLRRQQEFG